MTPTITTVFIPGQNACYQPSVVTLENQKNVMAAADTFRYFAEPANVQSHCIFCKIADGRVKPGDQNKPGEWIFDSESVVAFADINPGAKQHFLVVPKEHLKNCWSLSPKLLDEMDQVANKLVDAHNPKGERTRQFFIRPPWNSVYHVHLHVMIGELTGNICDLRKIGFLSPWFHITPKQLRQENGWISATDTSY